MNFGTESELVEFKRSTSLLKEGIVSLVAMLNKHGRGTIYFGVDDQGELTGQAIGKDTLRDIAQRIGEMIHPQIIPTIRIVHDEGTQGIVVEAAGNNAPYSCILGQVLYPCHRRYRPDLASGGVEDVFPKANHRRNRSPKSNPKTRSPRSYS
ncbi:MAG: ATP-binding protein [Bacillus subtilis]|nr:ATP-binding protein [Bacillus subtilis]